VDTGRDLGSSEQDGNYQEDFAIEGAALSGSGQSAILGMDTLNGVGIVMLNGASGSPGTDFYTPRIPKVSHGCPLCGNANI